MATLENFLSAKDEEQIVEGILFYSEGDDRIKTDPSMK